MGLFEVQVSTKRDLLVDLKKLHEKYLADFRDRVLGQIKNLDPTSFELFSKKLLEANVDSINISLDGATAETHNTIRRHEKSYDKEI